MKNVSKNSCKLPSCFRPVVDIDAMLDSSSSSRRFNSCVPVSQHKHHRQHHPPKPKPFLLIKFKALLIQTILNKRGSHETRNGISKRSEPGVDCKSTQEETKPEPALLPGGAVCDSTHNIPSQSHSSQCSCNETKEEEEKQSKNEIENEKRRRMGMGYCNMLVVSLTITVIRDKYWSVVFTSACLYLFCLWQARRRIHPFHNS